MNSTVKVALAQVDLAVGARALGDVAQAAELLEEFLASYVMQAAPGAAWSRPSA